MRAEVIAGYDRGEREGTDDPMDYPHEYPFCLIKIIAEPEDESENRVATYVEVKEFNNRESRLFVERSPPGMGWLEKVFDLVRETEVRGIISGGLHEIRIDCGDEIELLEDKPALIDHCEDEVYFDDGSAGNTMSLEEWKKENS